MIGNNTTAGITAPAPVLPPSALKLKQAFGERNNLPSHVTILLYGESLSGKTGKLLELAIAGYAIYLIDLDNQSDTVLTLADMYVRQGKYTQEQADVGLANVHVFKVADSVAIPNSALAVNRLITTGTLESCAKHNLSDCRVCKQEGEPVYTLDLRQIPENSFVAIDSLTALSYSELNLAKLRHGITFEDKADWDSFGVQGSILNGLLTLIKSATHNWIVVSHGERLKQNDGTNKMHPIGGTRNWALNLPRAFQATVYAYKEGGHYKLKCDPLDPLAVSGNRYGLRLQDSEGDSSLLPFINAQAREALLKRMAVKDSTPVTRGFGRG